MKDVVNSIDSCPSNGLPQATGTCWFNSAFNGFVLGRYLRPLIRYILYQHKYSKEQIDASKKHLETNMCIIDSNAITRPIIYDMFDKLLCENQYKSITNNDPAKAIDDLNIPKKAGLIPKLFKHDFVDGGWIPSSAVTALGKFLGLKYKIVSFDDEIDDNLDFIIVHPKANNLLQMYKFTRYKKDLPETIGKFTLDHACITYSIMHAVVGTFCDGQSVIYDSNYTRLFPFDWLHIKSKKLIAPSYIQKQKKPVSVDICYAVYVNVDNISKYSKHERTCVKIPKNIMNEDICIQFQKNKLVNPITKRHIKLGGPKYKELENMCIQMKSSNPSFTQRTPRPLFGFYIADIGQTKQSDKQLSLIAQMPCQFLVKSKTLSNVAKMICKIEPSSLNTFLISCINKVNTKLEGGCDVYIVGYAYGGTIASQIAKHFNTTIWRKKGSLHIATFGSNYIDKNNNTDIDIVNYMYMNDVALKCNKCDITDKHCNVKWLQDKKKDSDTHVLFGNNKYTDMILTVFQNNNIHINVT
jgi:hypothetical protein